MLGSSRYFSVYSLSGVDFCVWCEVEDLFIVVVVSSHLKFFFYIIPYFIIYAFFPQKISITFSFKHSFSSPSSSFSWKISIILFLFHSCISFPISENNIFRKYFPPHTAPIFSRLIFCFCFVSDFHGRYSLQMSYGSGWLPIFSGKTRSTPRG